MYYIFEQANVTQKVLADYLLAEAVEDAGELGGGDGATAVGVKQNQQSVLISRIA